MSANIEDGTIPFIMFFSQSRRNADALPGTYDDNLDVRVIDVLEKKIPLIRTTSLPEIITCTKVQRESTDEQCNLAILETMTKTEAFREEDDNSLTLNELFTKTEVNREQEDNGVGY